jgi:hypothetical protein
VVGFNRRFPGIYESQAEFSQCRVFFTGVKQILALRKPILKEVWPKLAFAGNFLPTLIAKTQKTKKVRKRGRPGIPLFYEML